MDVHPIKNGMFIGIDPSWVISHVPIFHITQPWSVYGLLDGYFFRWCPIFPSHGTVTNPKNYWDLWMFIPLKIDKNGIFIGIDPYPFKTQRRKVLQPPILASSVVTHHRGRRRLRCLRFPGRRLVLPEVTEAFETCHGGMTYNGYGVFPWETIQKWCLQWW